MIVNGVVYNDVQHISMTLSNMDMLTKAIDAFFLLYSQERYTLLNMSARLMTDGGAINGLVGVTFNFTLTANWEYFLSQWGKR